MEIYSKIAGILSSIAYCIYIISTLLGKTKPSRSTWWILTLVGSLILLSSYYLGATESIWIQITYIGGPLIIALLSIKYGEGKGLSTIDKTCLYGALTCAILWMLFNSPFIAFIGSIVVDLIGLIPTIKKAYLEPDEEDPIAWLIEMIASFMNAAGITVWFSYTENDWIYATYLILINLLITMLLWRKKVKTLRT